MTAATNIQIKNYRDGAVEIDWFDRSENYTLVAGYGYGGSNWVMLVRFELESACEGLRLKLVSGAARGGYRLLNYKVISAADYDPNSPYNNATYDMDCDGTVTMSQSNYSLATTDIGGIRPAGTYYLYLWTAKPASASATCYSTISNNGNGRITVEYNAIAGTASTIALTGNVMGSPVTIQIIRDNADFVHTLTWSFAGHSGTIVAKTGDTIVSWTPGADTFGAYIPTASSGTLTVSCTTYYGSEQIGTAQTASLTLSVPSDAAPTLSDGWASVSYSNSGTAAEGIAACITGYSRATVTFNSAKITAKYGATVKTLTATMGGSSVTGSGAIGTVSGTSNTVTLTVTDSRGKKASQTVTLTAYAYSKPVLGGVTVFRCSSAGAEDDSGAYYSAKATVTYSTAGGKISCALTAAIKAVGGSYGTAASLTPGTASVLGGGLSATVSYIVRIRAVDSLGNAAVVEVMIPTAAVAFHIPDGGNGLGLGKYNESPGAVDSAWDIQMNDHKVTGLHYPTSGTDAMTKGYADGAYAPKSLVYNYYVGAYFNSVEDILNAELSKTPNLGARNFQMNDNSTTSSLGLGGIINFTMFAGEGQAAVVGTRYWIGGEKTPYQVMRHYANGAWEEWEYVNPPMKVGVEYRTTERYNGKAVYVQAISCGAMPNAAIKTVATTIPKNADIVSQDITYYLASTGESGEETLLRYDSPLISSGAIKVRHWFNSVGTAYQNLLFSSVDDRSAFTAYAVIKYTKG